MQTTSNPIRPPTAARARWPWMEICALLSVAQIVIAGYRFGVANQAIQIPLLKHLIDPTLYPRDPLIGTLAQVVPWKRLEVLIEAAQALGDEEKAHFVVAGADLFGEHRGYAVQLKALCARSGLSDRVHWLGWREDGAGILAALTAYLHTADAEPLGRAILEAMAVGTPCVAPAACGPAEIIRHGDTGLLYEPGNGADAARALRRVIHDPAFAEHLRLAARRDFQERFMAERMAAEIADVYRALVVE